MPTITIKYSCDACGINKADVDVPERAEDEDVVHWVQGLGEYIQKDHMEQSPQCRNLTCDLMIPTDNRKNIGGPVIN